MAGSIFTRYCACLGLLAIAPTVCLKGRAIAQDVPACLQHPAKLSDAAVQSFMERPAGLLETHPTGGVVMSAAIRRLAGSDITTVAPLAYLAKDANVSQVVAIGVGLAKAATVCKHKRPDLAQRISDEVKRVAVPTLSTVFAAGLTSDSMVAMGDLDAARIPGSTPKLAPELGRRAAAHDAPIVDARRSADSGAPQMVFGTGGILITVVNPVSPVR